MGTNVTVSVMVPAGGMSEFNQSFNRWYEGAVNKRDQLQVLIMAGMGFYASENEDSEPLTRLLLAVEETGFSVPQVQSYIQDHTNLVWNKKKQVFKKSTSKGATGETLAIEPQTVWFKYNKPSNKPSEFKVDQKINALAKQIVIEVEKGEKEVKGLESAANAFGELRAALDKARSMLKG